MQTLRKLKDALQEYHNEQANYNGRSIPTTLTDVFLIDFINKMEQKERQFCQERKT